MSDQDTTVNKLIIGLTGNIATGKSAVTKLARQRGALAIDTDKVVHQLMDTDAELQAALAVAFGSDIRHVDGRINRRKLGEIVFEDAAALSDLETMVHPAVRAHVAEQVAASEADVVVIEAIKLLEGPLGKLCHQVWVTRCSKQKQLERLMVCRGLAAETAATRIRAQGPQAEKVAQADVVIDTEGLMADTEKQFGLYWGRLPDPTAVARVDLSIAKAAPEPAPVTAKQGEAVQAKPLDAAPVQPKMAVARPDDLQTRRARPSDIPSILLLIQKATDGAVVMKRSDLLMALSERSYLIGQVGMEIGAVLGWSLDSQVARIDQIFLHPPSADSPTAVALLEEVEKSANAHLGEVIVAFLPEDEDTAVLSQLFAGQGYQVARKAQLPPAWQQAVVESQPPQTKLMVKVLQEHRLNKVVR